jgi:DNA transposition AAA+ family ATPase|tara:strand:+ start:168 stop:407 length:240 start_codon:yes stop_codon:yes gene_type:complete
MIDFTIMDEQAAARYLGGEDSPISARTMERWRVEKTGPTYVMIGNGRLVRYRKSDLNEYLQDCVRVSKPLIEKDSPHGK